MGLLAFDSLVPDRTMLTVIAGVLAVLFFLYQLGTVKVHPDEPTVVAPRVPVIGHLLGMAVHGGKYVKNIGLAHKHLPIFTLPVPNSRIYIVSDPSVAVVVQRASKSLSFTPLVPDITERVLGLDKRTVAIVKQNLDPLPGEEPGFLADMHDMQYTFLGPGQTLNDTSRDATQELYGQLGQYVTALRGRPAQSEVVDLLAWVRHFVAVGTAKFLYGPKNPFAADPQLEQAFWDFDHGLGGLLMGLFPSWTAAKAYQGREKLAHALKRYLEAGHHTEASRIVQNRVQIAEQYGFSVDMTARSELSFLFAGIVNTATTVFWILLQISARPELLRRVRAEVAEARQASEVHSGRGTLSMAVAKVKCVTLGAVFRECLRYGSENFSNRLVKEDTMLADKYFLRKGSVIQIAGSVIHGDGDIWGADAADFNPRRFMENKSGNSAHPAAFRAFGGGKTLCPGRHFATNQVLMFAAVVITCFDFEAPDGGEIEVPGKNDGVMPVHILEPLTKAPVKVVARLREEADEAIGWKVAL